MSKEQLKAFLEKVKADTSLQEKLNAAADVDSVVAIAKTAGFAISADDLMKTHIELSDAELERVAGGDWSGFTCPDTCILRALQRDLEKANISMPGLSDNKF